MTRPNGVLRWLFGCLGLAASGEAVPAPGPAEVRGVAAPAGREPASRDRDRDRDRERSTSLSDLDELEVSDVMVHRTAMRGINADEAPEAIVRTVLDSPFSRMPLWRGSTDNIIGVIHQAAMARIPTSGPPRTESSGASSTPIHSTSATTPATKWAVGRARLMEKRPAASSELRRRRVSTTATAANAVRIHTTIGNDTRGSLP